MYTSRVTPFLLPATSGYDGAVDVYYKGNVPLGYLDEYQAFAKIQGISTPLHIYLVNSIVAVPALPGLTALGFTAETRGPCVINAPRYIPPPVNGNTYDPHENSLPGIGLTIPHEVGHALGISLVNSDGESHDGHLVSVTGGFGAPGTVTHQYFPMSLPLDMPYSETPLMFASADTLTGWIREEDWAQANKTAATHYINSHRQRQHQRHRHRHHQRHLQQAQHLNEKLSTKDKAVIRHNAISQYTFSCLCSNTICHGAIDRKCGR